MVSHIPSDTRRSGSDKDGLNLPSFRDLVSFRGTVARTNTTDASFSTRGHEEANVTTSLPRRHVEESFKVVGVQRAEHRADHRHTTQHLPHRGRQQVRSEGVLQEQCHSSLTRNQRCDVLPSCQSRSGERYYAQDVDFRSVQPHAERAREGYEHPCQDRVDSRTFSKSEPPRREVAPTSHEMVRTTEKYQPIAPYPSNGRSTRIETSKVPDISRTVESDRRRLQVQVVKPPAPRSDSRWQPYTQNDHPHRSLSGQVSERHHQEETILVRPQPLGTQHHHVRPSLAPPSSSFNHLRREVSPRSKLYLVGSEGKKFNPACRHEESPPLPSRHDRARTFDYSCARLPNEISMRPPLSKARPPNTWTDHSHSEERHRQADDRRPSMQLTSSSAYAEEQRMYTALHSLYGSDVRDRLAGQREPERVTSAIVENYKRNGHERVKGGVSGRAVAGAARRFDQGLMHDHGAAPGVDVRKDHDGRTSSGLLERHASRPVAAKQEGQLGPTVVSPSSCKSYRPSHGRPEPALHLDRRYESIDPAGRSSDGDQHRSDHKIHEHEAELYSARVPHTPGQRRLQPSRRAQDDLLWTQNAGERVYSPQVRIPPALPLPRSATPVGTVLHQIRADQMDSHASSSAQYEMSSRASGYHRPNGIKVSASAHEQWHVQASNEQESHSISGFDDPMRSAKQVPKEGRCFLTRDNAEEHMDRRTADPEQHRTSRPAVVHQSDKSPSHRLLPATPIHRTTQVLHRSSSGRIPQASRSSPHSLRSRGDDARYDHQTQAAEVMSHSKNRHPVQPVHRPAPRISPLEDPPIVHRSRALPPVIASQHTSLHQAQPASHEHDHHSATAMPAPPTRPMKRHRADSDTSLVIKASRFTVVDEPRQADVRGPSCGLRSPPRHLRAPERESGSRQQRHLDDLDDARDAQRFSGESDAQSKSVNGSAPITPPLSST
ncbi:hypothetical protein PHSY_004541 [Pseudozyma hubeiensis SY62]|uniref:Uncharacterized protein n=1 Tax=Pseudozyma hubeiensis (strain SY62) TaxID=1305764 RepID=R9P6U1_PSEHS|nr:hypothetical protein PHSY_004541 [Pseudozyma hubeiensis SY62]GAC96957.1 hypothetical protein PHSY_004541 [Pseudozyma hubeiensis SY62]